MEIETYAIAKEEVISALETEDTLILATCADNRVTIRPMSHINAGLDVYFQTSDDSLKMQQIRINPKVALCVGSYQIEGTAEEQGPPLASENAFLAAAYEKKHPCSFQKYSAYPDEIVVCVTIQRVTQWRYIGGKPCVAKLGV